MNFLRFIIFAIILTFTVGVKAAETTVVKYPSGSTEYNLRTEIGLSIVELALEATEKDFGPWRIDRNDTQMERKRRVATLEQGDKANALMLPGKNEYDERFILVPIPVDKGLLGFRIAFVHADNADVLKAVENLEDLKKFDGCTNPSWNVTKTFENNRLGLVYFSRYEALFAGLERRRCDYFSRGIGEIKGEFQHFGKEFPSLAYENMFCLRPSWPIISM